MCRSEFPEPSIEFSGISLLAKKFKQVVTEFFTKCIDTERLRASHRPNTSYMPLTNLTPPMYVARIASM